MKRRLQKPTPEAKALSLFLMAYKSKSPLYKEKSKRINKQWDQYIINKITKLDYQKIVETMLEEEGGYAEVVEKTVKFYIDKTGEWTQKGDDKYCVDARVIADKLLAEK